MVSKMFVGGATSPNFNDRRDVDAPDMLILHHIGLENAQTACDLLCNPELEVSAHYLVEENGKTHALVPEDKRAWHAGVSHWAGHTDLNSRSIGIEIVIPPDDLGNKSFSDTQINQVIALCKIIVERWNIPASNILAHSDIAPGRKVDPGHMFPWERLAQEGIGLWPHPVEMDCQAAEDFILNPPAIHELLTSYGYNPETPYETLIVEFMRHFHPEKFTHAEDRPEPDILTIARLLALVRARHDLQT